MIQKSEIYHRQVSDALLIKYMPTKMFTDNLKSLLNPYGVKDFKDRGKYKQFKYQFNSAECSLTIQLEKKYFLQVLNLKKYEIILIGKQLQGLVDQYIPSLRVLIQNKLIKSQNYNILDADIIGLTLMKQFTITGFNKQPVTKRVYLRLSPFQFKRAPTIAKQKQCDQYFGLIIKQFSNNDAMMDQNIPIPTFQEFYKAPRASFLDDLYSNQSLLKRFNRFIYYHQINSLCLGLVPINHVMIRQFYQKSSRGLYCNSTRLKRITLDFKFTKFQTQRTDNKYIKYSDMSVALLFSSIEDQVCKQDVIKLISGNKSTGQVIQSNKQGNLFLLELNLDGVDYDRKNDKYYLYLQKLQQRFYYYLKKYIIQNNQTTFLQYLQFSSSSGYKGVKVKNQLSFCQLLYQLSAIIDILCFYYPIQQKKHDHNSHQMIDQNTISYDLRLPQSRMFDSTKFQMFYGADVRISPHEDKSGTLQAGLPKYRLIPTMLNFNFYKRKKALTSNQAVIQLQQTPAKHEQLTGLVFYLNQLLKKKNVRDCYNQILDISSCCLNLALSKNKQMKQGSEINFVKTNPTSIKTTLIYMNLLLQHLTKIFSTPSTCFVINVLAISKQLLQVKDPQEGTLFMQFTFKVLKITNAGWIELIPSCIYFVQYLFREKILFWRKKNQNQKQNILASFQILTRQLSQKEKQLRIIQNQNQNQSQPNSQSLTIKKLQQQMQIITKQLSNNMPSIMKDYFARNMKPQWKMMLNL